jgi:uncharacterized CHY-type Zn-finger protein
MGTANYELEAKTVPCAICGDKFSRRRYEDREICRACEQAAIEKSEAISRSNGR